MGLGIRGDDNGTVQTENSLEELLAVRHLARDRAQFHVRNKK